jgi:hypothetical protein
MTSICSLFSKNELYNLNFARVGGFHVEIDEKKDHHSGKMIDGIILIKASSIK